MVHNPPTSDRGRQLNLSPGPNSKLYILWWRINMQEDECIGPLGRYNASSPVSSKRHTTTRAEVPCLANYLREVSEIELGQV
jgi:hypothetical protein